MSSLFKIELIQPDFDEYYESFAGSVVDAGYNSQLLKELKAVSKQIDDEFKKGRENGDGMTAALHKALPLVKRVDGRIYEELRENVRQFTHYYGVNTMYEVGNTFLPFLKTSIALVKEAISMRDAEEKFQAVDSAPKNDSEAPKFDVFICHASEDKESFVSPLADKLKRAGIKVWYDEFILKWGDPLRASIDKGLSGSRYGIVVLSRSFLKKKKWTERELDGLFALESHGQKRILPIWHDISYSDILQYSPMLADRLAKRSDGEEMETIVSDILELLKKAD